MAVQDELWHEISWEDKKFFSNTSSTSYGNPVKAMFKTDANGNPMSQYLTKEGQKHFGCGKYSKENMDKEAKKERKAIKDKKKSGCCSCSICRCVLRMFCYFLPFGLNAYIEENY